MRGGVWHPPPLGESSSARARSRERAEDVADVFEPGRVVQRHADGTPVDAPEVHPARFRGGEDGPELRGVGSSST